MMAPSLKQQRGGKKKKNISAARTRVPVPLIDVFLKLLFGYNNIRALKALKRESANVKK